MLYEVVAYFQRRGRHDLAVRYGSLLRDGLDIEFLRIDEATNELAWQYLARRHDKGYSLADCASFVVMTRMGLRDALTFDHHFAQAGFRMLPGP